MAIPVILGVAAGLLAATPVSFTLRQAACGGKPSIGVGLGSVLASFFGIQLVVFAVHLASPTDTLPFGGAAAISFLVVATVAGLLAWLKTPTK